MKRFSDYLVEAIGDGPRIPHPEDAILQGASKAMDYALALEEIVQNPQAGTIKWDGGIALYFGRNQQGQFFMTDLLKVYIQQARRGGEITMLVVAQIVLTYMPK